MKEAARFVNTGFQVLNSLFSGNKGALLPPDAGRTPSLPGREGESRVRVCLTWIASQVISIQSNQIGHYDIFWGCPPEAPQSIKIRM